MTSWLTRSALARPRQPARPSRRSLPAAALPAPPPEQGGDQAAEPGGLVGQRAQLLVEHHGAEALGHGRQAFGQVAVVGELGVVQAAFEDALVTARDS